MNTPVIVTSITIIIAIIYLITAHIKLKNKKLTYTSEMREQDEKIKSKKEDIASIEKLLYEIDMKANKNGLICDISYDGAKQQQHAPIKIRDESTYKHDRQRLNFYDDTISYSINVWTLEKVIGHINKQFKNKYWMRPLLFTIVILLIAGITPIAINQTNNWIQERDVRIAQEEKDHQQQLEEIIQQVERETNTSNIEIVQDDGSPHREKGIVTLQDESGIYYEASYRENILVKIKQLPEKE